MSFKPTIKHIEKSDYNPQDGLQQLVVTLSNQSKCRLFLKKNPEWKVIAVNRLLNIPCPICRKDYYCSCMSKYAGAFEEQVLESAELQP